MAENMHEEFAIVPQPAGDSLKEFAVIPHVLEHFHRHDTIKLGINCKVIHIRCNDTEIAQCQFSRLTFDVFPLRCRVGNSGNATVCVYLGYPE